MAFDASVAASARSISTKGSSSALKARGRSSSMKRSAPRRLSSPTLTKMPGGSLMLSRAACISRGTWCSFETTRRGRAGRAAGALGERRVVEEDLPGEAGGEQIAVALGIPLPGADRLELEQARADTGVERGTFQPLGVSQTRGVDRAQPPREPAQIADLCVDRGATQILEQVVVQVDAV